MCSGKACEAFHRIVAKGNDYRVNRFSEISKAASACFEEKEFNIPSPLSIRSFHGHLSANKRKLSLSTFLSGAVCVVLEIGHEFKASLKGVFARIVKIRSQAEGNGKPMLTNDVHPP